MNRLQHICQLKAAGYLLHAGMPLEVGDRILDPGWIAANLWDFADLLDLVDDPDIQKILASRRPRQTVAAEDIIREAEDAMMNAAKNAEL
jgi:hypothetical protein